MKIISLILSLGCFTFVKAQNLDINGIWKDSSSTSFTNCYAIFSINNDSIFMTHYIEYNGNSFVEHGEGIIREGKLTYKVKVTKQIPGWTTTQGVHVLKLDSDGETLRGTFADNSGNSGPLVFKRRLPESPKKIRGIKID